jgi:hypothetical protein
LQPDIEMQMKVRSPSTSDRAWRSTWSIPTKSKE